MKCIYCDQERKFNGEHVFSAGLGGDDSRYMLHDAVCVDCNSAFSKLERELLRKSPTALARIAMQPSGRKRGSKKNEPTYTTDATYIVDESGRFLEADIGTAFATVVLPQIHIEGYSVGGTAAENKSLKEFHVALQELIGKGEFDLIEKVKEEDRLVYVVSPVRRGAEGYVLGEGVAMERPPKVGLWLQSVTPEKELTNRFYRSKSGGLTYKTARKDSLPESLVMLEKYFEKYEFLGAWTESTIENPLIQVETSANMSMADRVIAKIGVNFLAYLQGADYVRHPGFASIKRSILYGDPQLPFTHTEDEAIKQILGQPPKSHHALMLGAVPLGGGQVSMYMVVKLYESTVHQVLLAASVPCPQWSAPKFFLINYVEHVIEPIGMLDYMSRYCAIGQLVGDA